MEENIILFFYFFLKLKDAFLLSERLEMLLDTYLN